MHKGLCPTTTSSNYVRNDHYLYGQTVDVTPQPALPTNEIVVNMDSGVEWFLEERGRTRIP